MCVITDRETAIINTFEERLWNCKILICWKHIIYNKTYHFGWASTVEVDKAQVYVYILHKFNNNELCNPRYIWTTVQWNENSAFISYFEDILYNTIVKTSGRWLLEPFAIYNAWPILVTNNVAENRNAKLKRLSMGKSISMKLFYSLAICKELTRQIKAFCGESELIDLLQSQLT